MKLSHVISSALVGSGLVLTGQAVATPSWAKKGDTIVKCKGVAKKGKNDCGANNHACAGMAKKDNDPNEWVYVPSGVCEKLAKGVVLGEKKVAK